jgi:hypothetical protein
MNYADLEKEDFDAILTGEITHYALWFEEEINDILSDHFKPTKGRLRHFKTFVLQREGLTFQDKLEIVRGLLPFFPNRSAARALKPLLNEVEDFKAWRNALAHGQDVTENNTGREIEIATVSRSGRQRVYKITPASHAKKLGEAEKLLKKLQTVRSSLQSKVPHT